VSISPGFTAAEIHDFVVEYHLQPYGQKEAWRAAQGVSVRQLRRWEATVFAGDLDRGLIPREGSGMTGPPGRRAAFVQAKTAKQEREAAELAGLRARVRELEATNEALGKAIGLLHELNVPGPDSTPTIRNLDDSSTPRTDSSPS
jgi:hypothetical protein